MTRRKKKNSGLAKEGYSRCFWGKVQVQVQVALLVREDRQAGRRASAVNEIEMLYAGLFSYVMCLLDVSSCPRSAVS
jgi:hypothetical protein